MPLLRIDIETLQCNCIYGLINEFSQKENYWKIWCILFYFNYHCFLTIAILSRIIKGNYLLIFKWLLCRMLKPSKWMLFCQQPPLPPQQQPQPPQEQQLSQLNLLMRLITMFTCIMSGYIEGSCHIDISNHLTSFMKTLTT